MRRPLRSTQRYLMPMAALGCLLILSGLLLLAAGTVIGCHTDNPINPQPPLVEVLPKTEFTPPTTVPSVTPAAAVAATQAGVINDRAINLYPKVVGLTPTNVDAEKPGLLTGFQDLLKGVALLVGYTEQAHIQGQANDVAVAGLTADVRGARALVGVREEQLKTQADTHATQMKDKDTFWQGKVKTVETDRDDWKSKATSADAAMLRWIWGSCIGIGILCVLGGGLMFFLISTARTPGAILAGLGVVCIGLGMAATMFGREIAIAGLVIAASALIAGIWAAIHYVRQDAAAHAAAAVEIADGVQQAINAGVIDKVKAAPFFDQAQSPMARMLVKVATDSKQALVEAKNPFRRLLPGSV